MSTTIKTKLPDPLFRQAQFFVQQGWIANMDELVSESVRRYLESHVDALSEQFIRDDVDWGLHGQD